MKPQFILKVVAIASLILFAVLSISSLWFQFGGKDDEIIVTLAIIAIVSTALYFILKRDSR